MYLHYFMAKEEFHDMESEINEENLVWQVFLNLVQSTTDKSEETKAKIAKNYLLLQCKTDEELLLELKQTQPGFVLPESTLYGEELALYSSCINYLIYLRQ